MRIPKPIPCPHGGLKKYCVYCNQEKASSSAKEDAMEIPALTMHSDGSIEGLNGAVFDIEYPNGDREGWQKRFHEMMRLKQPITVLAGGKSVGVISSLETHSCSVQEFLASVFHSPKDTASIHFMSPAFIEQFVRFLKEGLEYHLVPGRTAREGISILHIEANPAEPAPGEIPGKAKPEPQGVPVPPSWVDERSLTEWARSIQSAVKNRMEKLEKRLRRRGEQAASIAFRLGWKPNGGTNALDFIGQKVDEGALKDNPQDAKTERDKEDLARLSQIIESLRSLVACLGISGSMDWKDIPLKAKEAIEWHRIELHHQTDKAEALEKEVVRLKQATDKA